MNPEDYYKIHLQNLRRFNKDKEVSYITECLYLGNAGIKKIYRYAY